MRQERYSSMTLKELLRSYPPDVRLLRRGRRLPRRFLLGGNGERRGQPAVSLSDLLRACGSRYDFS